MGYKFIFTCLGILASTMSISQAKAGFDPACWLGLGCYEDWEQPASQPAPKEVYVSTGSGESYEDASDFANRRTEEMCHGKAGSSIRQLMEKKCAPEVIGCDQYIKMIINQQITSKCKSSQVPGKCSESETKDIDSVIEKTFSGVGTFPVSELIKLKSCLKEQTAFEINDQNIIDFSNKLCAEMKCPSFEKEKCGEAAKKIVASNLNSSCQKIDQTKYYCNNDAHGQVRDKATAEVADLNNKACENLEVLISIKPNLSLIAKAALGPVIEKDSSQERPPENLNPNIVPPSNNNAAANQDSATRGAGTALAGGCTLSASLGSNGSYNYLIGILPLLFVRKKQH